MFFMALAAMFFSACDATEIDNSTVKAVDLNRYLGSWYEIAKYDHVFERGLDYAMANYTLREDGKIDVLNTGIKDGRAKDAKGIAKTTNIPGLLKVSFFGPFYSDYRIMMLDTNYQYVLVGGSNDKYLWILSRTPQLDEATKALILAEADKRGYDTSKLIWVKQQW
jgi:lipocalin